jgi:hypothetical protein
VHDDAWRLSRLLFEYRRDGCRQYERDVEAAARFAAESAVIATHRARIDAPTPDDLDAAGSFNPGWYGARQLAQDERFVADAVCQTDREASNARLAVATGELGRRCTELCRTDRRRRSDAPYRSISCGGASPRRHPPQTCVRARRCPASRRHPRRNGGRPAAGLRDLGWRRDGGDTRPRDLDPDDRLSIPNRNGRSRRSSADEGGRMTIIDGRDVMLGSRALADVIDEAGADRSCASTRGTNSRPMCRPRSISISPASDLAATLSQRRST